MTPTRRSFVWTLGLTAMGSRGSAFSLRGLEASLAASQDDAPRAPRAPLPKDAIRLDSNENPYGPGPVVVEAVSKALKDGNRYPRTAMDLSDSLVPYLCVKDQTILLAAGSGDLLRASVQAFTGPEKALVVFSPTFESPVRLAEMMKTPVRRIRIKEGTLSLDLPELVAQSKGAGLVYLCNPNNPTGTFLTRAAVADAVAEIGRTSPQTVVLVDEAYFDCADDPSYGSVAALAADTPNLIVARTFSKIHGLAGLRVGYAVAQPATLARLRLFAGQGVVTGVSAAAALASLQDTAHYAESRRLNLETKAFTMKALAAMGHAPVASQGNFVMVDVKRNVRAFQEECRKKNVFVARPFPPLDTYARITVGTRAEMARAVEVFESVLDSEAPSTTTSNQLDIP